MPRAPREDFPGSWHHVINRAIGRRTLLERREDFRIFMALLAYAVRRGELQVHAYSLMGTHFHLLVQSPLGELAKPMQRIQLAYSRWFNRSRKRDGSLVRGRYVSKRIDSESYAQALVRYIDANPIKAGMVASAPHYPYGSALHYARSSGPPWLARSWIEEVVRERSGSVLYRPEQYERYFGPLSDELESVIERRIRHKANVDPLENLVTSSPRKVREWMVRKASLADGTAPNLPVLSFRVLLARLDTEGRWTLRSGRVERDARGIATAGLGRELCGATLEQVARQLEVSLSTASKLCRIHGEEVRRDGAYAEWVAGVVAGAMDVWASA